MTAPGPAPGPVIRASPPFAAHTNAFTDLGPTKLDKKLTAQALDGARGSLAYFQDAPGL